jgi:uroporphyrinogen decarboxylase
MTRRERVTMALDHQEPDIVPYHITFTIPILEQLRRHTGRKDIDSLTGNHLAIYNPVAPDAWVEVEPNTWRDQFGVIWDRTIDKDIGNVANCCLPEPTLDGCQLPDPHDPRRYDRYEEFCRTHADAFVLNEIGFSLFERAWTLRGMENLLIDMHLHPEFVEELLDAIVEYNLAILRHALEFPIDGCRFGDDWGTQQGVMMGPELWRRFLKPRLARQYALVHEHGRRVFIHSCGAVSELFDDLIEIGVDCFNPFQPEVMDVYEMKRRYGGRLSFYGGLSTQRTLPFGSPDEVQAEARRLMREIGRDGGYILAPAHDVPRDVPLANVLALIEAAREQAP